MRELTLGDASYRLVGEQREGTWFAHAERADTGSRFGIEAAGETEEAALRQLADWLEWQHEHAAALDALQQAERAYHRTLAGGAFANPAEGPSQIEIQKESLDAVEAARVRLDEIRARKPE
jgi:hypothetical protein